MNPSTAPPIYKTEVNLHESKDQRLGTHGLSPQEIRDLQTRVAYGLYRRAETQKMNLAVQPFEDEADPRKPAFKGVVLDLLSALACAGAIGGLIVFW